MGFGKITPKQQEILEYIKDEILRKGYPPPSLGFSTTFFGSL